MVEVSVLASVDEQLRQRRNGWVLSASQKLVGRQVLERQAKQCQNPSLNGTELRFNGVNGSQRRN